MATNRSAGQEAFDDWRQLKSDNKAHAFTSESSLRQYARYLRVTGSPITKEQVDDALMWLSIHGSELDGELYDRDGLPRFAKAEFPSSWGSHQGDDSRGGTNANGFKEMGDMREGMGKDTADSVLTDTTGMYYTAELTCNQTDGAMFGQIAKSIDDPEQRAAFKALGPRVPVVRNLIRLKRGRLYEQHAERQAKRLRWLGMEEYDAVAKADEHLRQGVKLSKAESNANPLPPLEELCETLSYDSETGVFTRLKSSGPAKAGSKAKPTSKGQIKVNGVFYYASRLAVLLMTGSDPASATVDFKNGDRTDLRWDNLTVEEHTMRSTGGSTQRRREGLEDRFDSQVWLGGKNVTIGTYRTERQAEEARRLFKRSLELG